MLLVLHHKEMTKKKKIKIKKKKKGKRLQSDFKPDVVMAEFVIVIFNLLWVTVQ